MEEFENVFYVESNEDEVASNYIIEETTDNNESSNKEDQDIYIENNDDEQEEKTSDSDSFEGELEQIIVMKEDGKVEIVKKKGNEDKMVLGSYVDENTVGDSEKDVCGNECNDLTATNLDMEKNQDTICSDPKEQSSGKKRCATGVRSRKKAKRKISAEIVNRSESCSPEPNEEGQAEGKFACNFCTKTFSRSSNRQRHIRIAHGGEKKVVGSDVRCVECDIVYRHIHKLREHLHSKHGLDMSVQSLTFPNMSAFKKWKCEIERKTLSSYTLRHGSRRTSKGPKLFYMCHRSGRYQPKKKENRQRILRTSGTCKMGIACTAAMYCLECPNQVEVCYCPHHYGHGKETSLVQISPAEQAAMQESVSSGVPFEDLMDDIREGECKDTFQMQLMKSRDLRWIKSAFKAEEYDPGISDAESVENWVKRCCQMEDSPVLFYKQQDIGCDQEEFMLVIMTEFQKHVLLSAKRNIVCIDSVYRRKGGRFYLTVMVVMDEFDNPFPGAFCISNKVDRSVIDQFLISVKESTGNLSFKHFISDNDSFYYESWVSVMQDEPRWLWALYCIDGRIRTQLKLYRGNVVGRADVYKSIRTLMECQNETVFTCMFKNFIETLNKDSVGKKFADFIMSKFGSNTEMWATCYRKEVNLSINIHLESMHRTFRYCCREGRKKRLDKFLFVVMKLIKCKMLDRISDLLDNDKLNMAIEAINMCHASGLEIRSDHMSALSDKIWLIRTDNDEEPMYVTKELDKCPEICSLRCDECDICVHQYSCTCVQSMIDANLCKHIHAVVWNFLTPHFSPAASPSHSMDPIDDDMEISNYFSMDAFFGNTLKKTHEVYRKIKANKCNLNKDALDSIMKRLNECVDICVGKKIDEPLEINPAPTTMLPNEAPSQTTMLPNKDQPPTSRLPKKAQPQTTTLPNNPQPSPTTLLNAAQPLTTTLPNNVYLINPNGTGSTGPNPFILQSPQPVNNNAPVTQYIMLLPNNGKIIPKL